MCNCEEDLNCILKYKPKLSLYDKIFMGLILLTLIICVGFLIYGVFNPKYLVC